MKSPASSCAFVAARAEWVRGEQALLPRLAEPRRASMSFTASRARRRCEAASDVSSRSTTSSTGSTREAHFGLRSLGMRVLVPHAARRSHRIIAPSESTRRDVVQFLGVEAARRSMSFPRACACRTTSRRWPRPSYANVTGSAADRSCCLRRRSGRTRTCCACSTHSRSSHRRIVPFSFSPVTRRPTRRSFARMRLRSASRMTLASSVGSQPPSSRALYGPRSASSFRRCTRASGCRCSKRWRVAFPSRARIARPCRRSQVTPRCSSIPNSLPQSQERSRHCYPTSLSEIASAAPGSSEQACSPGPRRPRATIDTYLA